LVLQSNLKEKTMPYLPQEEVCPISEQLLFSLYDAAKRGLPVPVAEVPPEKTIIGCPVLLSSEPSRKRGPGRCGYVR
jgi:hypothetical protein